MKVGWVEQELPVNHAEVFAVFVDTAFAQQEHLVSLGHGFNSYRPFFKGHLAFVG